MEVFDAPLQLQDLIVPRLDLVERLLRRFSVDQDLKKPPNGMSFFYDSCTFIKLLKDDSLM